jgi:hypothetical protein
MALGSGSWGLDRRVTFGSGRRCSDAASARGHFGRRRTASSSRAPLRLSEQAGPPHTSRPGQASSLRSLWRSSARHTCRRAAAPRWGCSSKLHDLCTTQAGRSPFDGARRGGGAAHAQQQRARRWRGRARQRHAQRPFRCGQTIRGQGPRPRAERQELCRQPAGGSRAGYDAAFGDVCDRVQLDRERPRAEQTLRCHDQAVSHPQRSPARTQAAWLAPRLCCIAAGNLRGRALLQS